MKNKLLEFSTMELKNEWFNYLEEYQLLAKIMVTCREDNIESSKTIEKNHGILKKIIDVSEENSNFKIYRINVKEGLND